MLLHLGNCGYTRSNFKTMLCFWGQLPWTFTWRGHVNTDTPTKGDNDINAPPVYMM